uniref:Uncharacterized protein n=1 Tax=Romanomermis culicivorax TaxID=13658 RepID=A0A915JT61_ROMCU
MDDRRRQYASPFPLSSPMSPYLDIDRSIFKTEPQYIMQEGASQRRGRFEMALPQIGACVIAGACIGGMQGLYRSVKAQPVLSGGGGLLQAARRAHFLNAFTKYAFLDEPISSVRGTGEFLVFFGFGAVFFSGTPVNSAANDSLTPLAQKNSLVHSRVGSWLEKMCVRRIDRLCRRRTLLPNNETRDRRTSDIQTCAVEVLEKKEPRLIIFRLTIVYQKPDHLIRSVFISVRRSLGSQCSSNSDCSKDIFRGECVNEVCQCQSAYKPACPPNAPCQCVSRVLGDQCAQDQDCTTSIPNSVCTSSTCQCATGYSPNLCRQCVISHQFENAMPQSINALSVPYYTGHFQNLGIFG